MFINGVQASARAPRALQQHGDVLQHGTQRQVAEVVAVEPHHAHVGVVMDPEQYFEPDEAGTNAGSAVVPAAPSPPPAPTALPAAEQGSGPKVAP